MFRTGKVCQQAHAEMAKHPPARPAQSKVLFSDGATRVWCQWPIGLVAGCLKRAGAAASASRFYSQPIIA